MDRDLLVRALRAALDVLEQAPADSAVSAEPFDADHLPPGAASWRAVLEAGRRGEIEVTKIGRRAVVTREAWAAFVEAKKPKRTARPATVTASGDARLRRLGLVSGERMIG
jgi:hypothetical protein